jgi:hypothetical protein
MELFFNEVSEGTRALGSSINLLTTAIGTYLAGALNIGECAYRTAALSLSWCVCVRACVCVCVCVCGIGLHTSVHLCACTSGWQQRCLCLHMNHPLAA